MLAPASTTGSSVSWSPVVAADGSGRLTAAWFGDGAAGFGVYAASRAAALSGAWSTPIRLGAALAPRDLQLAVNASGQAVAGWVDVYPNLTQRLVTATRTAGGSWSAATLFPAIEAEYAGHGIEVDGTGQAIGLWATGEGMLGGLSGTIDSPLSLDGTGPVPAVSSDGSAPFDLALDGAGRATALFLDATGLALFSSTRPSGGSWQTPQLVERWTPPSDSETGSLEAPKLAVNASGRAVAVWMRRADAGSGLQSAVRPAGGTWSASSPLASITNQRYVVTSGVGIDAAGTATAAWDVVAFEVQLAGSVRFWTEVRSMTAPATGTTWNPVEIRGVRKQLTFTPSADPNAPAPELPVYTGVKVGVGAGGPAIVTWLERLGNATSLAAAARAATGGWQPASQIASLDVGDLDDLSLVTAVAVDSAGRATAVWTDGRTVRSRSLALAALPAEPGPVDPGPVDPGPVDPGPVDPQPEPEPAPTPPAPLTLEPAPTPGGGAPPASPPAATVERAPRLVVAMHMIPRGRRCPPKANGTVAGKRTPLKVKASKIRGKVRCKVTGTIVLASTVKPGTQVTVLVTAKGVKRKTVRFVASR